MGFGVYRSPVSAPALVAGGRGFESRYPDNFMPNNLFIRLLGMVV